MTIFERIAEMLDIPYYKAVQVVAHKEELRMLFNNYDEQIKENHKCLACGRPVERQYVICDECMRQAGQVRDDYIKSMKNEA